jgi:hypothetical protein
MDLGLAIAMLVAVVAALGWTGWAHRRQRRRFREGALPFRDVLVVSSAWTFGLDTLPPHPRGSIRAAGGGKNNPARWDVSAAAPRLSPRTSLSIDRRGGTALGRRGDVRLGDAAFDGALRLRGRDPDVVRGVCRGPLVAAAVHALFADPEAYSFVITENGEVHARFGRRANDAGTARDKLLLVTALLRVIEDHADAAPALDDAARSEARSVGGATGAPVLVPVFPSRR